MKQYQYLWSLQCTPLDLTREVLTLDALLTAFACNQRLMAVAAAVIEYATAAVIRERERESNQSAKEKRIRTV